MKTERIALALTVVNLLILAGSAVRAASASSETVLFRLIDENGRPGVKIGTSADGSGISLAGDSERRDWNGVQVLAADTGALVKLTNKDGRQLVVRP